MTTGIKADIENIHFPYQRVIIQHLVIILHPESGFLCIFAALGISRPQRAPPGVLLLMRRKLHGVFRLAHHNGLFPQLVEWNIAVIAHDFQPELRPVIEHIFIQPLVGISAGKQQSAKGHNINRAGDLFHDSTRGFFVIATATI